MKSKPKLVAKSFKATIERPPSRFNFVLIRIPFDVTKAWGTCAKVRVKGKINCFRIRAWFCPTTKAELDLPPIVKRAFASDPRAYKGWQSMTPLQRRYQLLGIFYCRTPETRDRRIAKMMEDALARNERKPGTKSAPEKFAHEEFE